MKKIGIGIIGCGAISGIYLDNLVRVFSSTEVVACASLRGKRARARAEEYGIPKACSVEELLSDGDVEIVLNLTVPEAHAEISLAALKAGKSVYSEKPLAVEREDGYEILELAHRQRLLVGCAPDTFLGAGLQECRRAIDEGLIGRPVAATAFMLSHGHESWHPDPEFYYKKGGGPLFDMGPYYLTALIALLGPVTRVTGSAQTSFSRRTISSEPKRGEEIEVEVPTHVAGVLDFKRGSVATIVTSFDVWAHQVPRIEIYGSEGTLSLPDPNTFGGPVTVRRPTDEGWWQLQLSHPYSENSRGIGVADMARTLRTQQKHRASGELAYHVLDVMQGLQEASESGRHYVVRSTCERPEALRPEDRPDVLEE